MEKTFHSLMRCRQRGIAETNIELILSLGTSACKPGGVVEYFVSKKDKQRAVEFFTCGFKGTVLFSPLFSIIPFRFNVFFI